MGCIIIWIRVKKNLLLSCSVFKTNRKTRESLFLRLFRAIFCFERWWLQYRLAQRAWKIVILFQNLFIIAIIIRTLLLSKSLPILWKNTSLTHTHHCHSHAFRIRVLFQYLHTPTVSSDPFPASAFQHARVAPLNKIIITTIATAAITAASFYEHAKLRIIKRIPRNNAASQWFYNRNLLPRKVRVYHRRTSISLTHYLLYTHARA